MIGFRIFPLQNRIHAQWVEKFRNIPVANVSDVMARMTGGGVNLRPMHAGGVLSGPAFTVKTRPGDNLMVHKALSMAAPGDVIVVDAGGDLTRSEEHTSELQSLMRISYAVFCLKKKKNKYILTTTHPDTHK